MPSIKELSQLILPIMTYAPALPLIEKLITWHGGADQV